MLIEIHMIQNHAPCNMNRDDSGSPKDCIFGGIRRSRISSQSIKRSIRLAEQFQKGMKGIDLAMRTRRLPELVKQKLLSDGIDEKMATIAAQKVAEFGKKESKEDVKEKESKAEEITAQTMFITQKDVEAIASAMKKVILASGNPKDFEKIKASDIQKKELKAWRPITPDIALFGRMITSEAFADVEASMQVAHAISTNKMDHEFDYFTAVDDLQKKSGDDNTGADMIGDIEFNSACYYKYFSLDYDALIENLAGPEPDIKAGEQERNVYKESLENAKKIAAVTVRSFLEAAIHSTPSGKQNTFAAHQLPHAILIEIRPNKTPVSYANAFVKPAAPKGNMDLIDDSVQKFTKHVELTTSKFNLESMARFWFILGENKLNGAVECQSIDNMIVNLQKYL